MAVSVDLGNALDQAYENKSLRRSSPHPVRAGGPY
jgi:hypothetical protein